MTDTTLNWTIHDDGYWLAKGRKGRYEISEALSGRGQADIRLPTSQRITCSWEDAKSVAEGYDAT